MSTVKNNQTFAATDKTGRPRLTAKSCSCDMGSVSITFHGGQSWIYNLFSSIVANNIKGQLQGQVGTAPISLKLFFPLQLYSTRYFFDSLVNEHLIRTCYHFFKSKELTNVRNLKLIKILQLLSTAIRVERMTGHN